MANPRTINLPGSRTATQSYELAPGLAQYVQSVYAVIDNTAGTDATATLTISEQSGVVIAKKRQSDKIPAGDTGSLTWALRLDDNGTNGGGTTQGVSNGVLVQQLATNNNLPAATNLFNASSAACGYDRIGYDDDTYFSATHPTRLTATTAGVYVVQGAASLHVNTISPATYMAGVEVIVTPSTRGVVFVNQLSGNSRYLDEADVELTECGWLGKLDAGNYVEMWATSNYTGGITRVGDATFSMHKVGEQK